METQEKTIPLNLLLNLIDEHEGKYKSAMNSCHIEDSRTYYSNQTAVIALEDLKVMIKRFMSGADR